MLLIIFFVSVVGAISVTNRGDILFLDGPVLTSSNLVVSGDMIVEKINSVDFTELVGQLINNITQLQNDLANTKRDLATANAQIAALNNTIKILNTTVVGTQQSLSLANVQIAALNISHSNSFTTIQKNLLSTNGQIVALNATYFTIPSTIKTLNSSLVITKQDIILLNNTANTQFASIKELQNSDNCSTPQIYTTPGTYTYVVPQNVKSLHFTIAGGGSGGGCTVNGNSSPNTAIIGKDSSVSGICVAKGGYSTTIDTTGNVQLDGGQGGQFIRLPNGMICSNTITIPTEGVNGNKCFKNVNVTPGQSFTVIVGAGGQEGPLVNGNPSGYEGSDGYV